jgi:hypothetical protein
MPRWDATGSRPVFLMAGRIRLLGPHGYDENTIVYPFTVDDPGTWTRPRARFTSPIRPPSLHHRPDPANPIAAAIAARCRCSTRNRETRGG